MKIMLAAARVQILYEDLPDRCRTCGIDLTDSAELNIKSWDYQLQSRRGYLDEKVEDGVEFCDDTAPVSEGAFIGSARIECCNCEAVLADTDERDIDLELLSLADILWPGGRKGTDWNLETIQKVAQRLIELGFGPGDDPDSEHVSPKANGAVKQA